MNILMIEFWGSFNRYSLNLARALCKLNVELTLVSVEGCIQEPSRPYELVSIFPSFGKKNSLFRKLFKYIRAYFLAVRLAKKLNIKLIHIQYFRILAGDWIFWVIMKILRLRIIYTAHNILPHERKKYHKHLFRLIYRLCDLIVVTSESGRRQIEAEFGVGPRKVTVIPIGHLAPPGLPVLSKEEARNLLGIPLDVNLILSIGILREYKGIDTAIKAVPNVRRKIKNVKLLITGTCSDESLLKYYCSLIRELKIEDVVEMRIGFIDEKDMSLYMASSDVVILPYKRASGHSGVLFTAYYFAKPLIASAVGGLSEAVEDGKSGFLVPPDDETELANAIVNALANPEELIKMGQYARFLNENKYSWARIGEATVQAYRYLACNRFPAP